MKISKIRLAFGLLSIGMMSIVLTNGALAVISTVDPIPFKYTGDPISADDVNNLVGVLKGVTHDDNGTFTDYLDDKILVQGTLCDNNGCLDNLTGSGPWSALPDTSVDTDLVSDGLYYGGNVNGERVGIGTTNPLGVLHLDRQNGEGPLVVSKGSFGWTPNALDDVAIGDGVSYWGINAGDDFKLGRAGINHLFIDRFGKVGIGAETPDASLHIKNSTGSAVIKLESQAGASSRLFFSENSTDKWSLGHDTSNDTFSIHNTEVGSTALSIDQVTGNIGINKTDPSEKLEVDGNIIVTAGNDICLSSGRCLSQNNGSGTTQHEGLPDAIKCDINNPDWGVAAFYLTYAPISDTSWETAYRGKFFYRLLHADRITVIYDSDKTFYGYQNITSTDCDGKSIQQLYNEGKAFNFLSMPVCNDQQTLKFNDSTKSWECADTSTTLPYCIQGQTLNFDATNSQWVCAANANLPTCAENQILSYNSMSTAWECNGGIGFLLPSCADNQILNYNAAMLQWECANESGGAGSSLPTCSEGMIAQYQDATNTWVCGDKRPVCADAQILVYNDILGDWECKDNEAAMPACFDGQILTYDETTFTWECANNSGGSGGSTTDESILALYKHSTQTLGSVYESITFDNQIRIDDPYTHSVVTNSGEITIEEDGWYELTYHVSTDVDSGTSRSGSTAKLEIEIGGFWGELPGTLTHMYNRNDVAGGTSASTTIWHQFATGDKVRLMARQESGTSTITTLPDAVGFTIRKEGGLGGAVALPDTDWSINGDDLRAGVSGNVGIGVAAPLAKLDVDGGIKIGNDLDVCDSTKYGTTRYNTGKLQLCTVGDLWKDVGTGGGGGKFVEGANPLDAVYNDGRVGIGVTVPLGQFHIKANGGFGPEDADGVTIDTSVPFLLEGDSTVLGMLNGDGRSAFAINLSFNSGTKTERGIPTFYDKYDGNWHRSLSLKNGNIGIGTYTPTEKLDVIGNIKASGTICDSLGNCLGGDGGSGVGKIFVEEDNINRSFGSSWANGMILKNRTIRDGWDLSLHYELPARNDYMGDGGGYTELQYSINGGGWQSLGNSGHQLAMGYSAREIRTDTRTVYMQRGELTGVPSTGDFDIQFKFRHKSYNGTLYINQGRGTSDSKFASLFILEEKKFSY